MAFLEILQLIGYSTAAALHAWIAASLVRRRRLLAPVERVLLVLALTLGVWHASNLLVALHAMLGLSEARWTVALRLTDTLAVASVTLTYSLLLHVHLHLWADARRRSLTWSERARVYLSYVPALFLVYAAAKLWQGAYAPMFVKLSQLLLPFATWAAYVLCLVAGTDFLIARLSKSQTERRLMRTLAASFLAIAALILAVYAFGLGQGTTAGQYLKTLANLGSLLPTALLAYYIYRYRYLELILKESLILASFASVVLVVYLYGIRNIALWLTARYELREGSVESLLILLLVLVAAPLRRWLDKRFRHLFEQEAGLFRDVVARVGKSAGRYGQLPEFLRFVEERAAESLGLRRVRLLAASDNEGESGLSLSPNGGKGSEGPTKGGATLVKENGARRSTANAQVATNSPPLTKSSRVDVGTSVVVNASADADASVDTAASAEGAGAEGWESGVLDLARAADWEPVEGADVLKERGWELAYPLRREERVVGLMLVDADSDALTFETRALLELLAGQVAIAIEDSRLVEENVRLERRIAQSERLAALGRMAATVAHEVKNPLSAIKSIAQVMREDEYLRREYARDLELIVGETDRLSGSVTQMLSFARTPPPAGSPLPADDLLQTVAQLSQRDAAARGISVKLDFVAASVELDGARAAALRDAASNLILNALQASRPGGRVRVEARVEGERLLVSVADEGPGVPAERRERIWEPFFTTKQRGTGLGLAIVRKRIEEAGGEARLAPQRPGEGARFELTIPIQVQSSELQVQS
ncbi:MAG TPA: ATP-binding protein [Pyrinomonadaceae bacterium]|nr:ATP-binding protein [Pyrinomonadaceae bacterium]